MKTLFKNFILVVLLVLSLSTVAFAQEYHEVKRGDTLWAISQKYKVTVQQIKDWNKLKNETIYVGQKLIVKDSKKENNKTEKKTYKVKANDTLWSIANKNGVTVQELMSWNNLKNDLIRVGQVLKLYKENGDSSSSKPNENNTSKDALYHEVKKGDTLWSISRKYNVSVQNLMNWNNLSNSVIHIGQKIKIEGAKASKDYNKITKATTTANLNMRDKKSTSGNILLTIPKGSTIEVLDSNGTWWKVKYNGKTGYSHSGYLTVGDTKTEKARVTAGGLYMRKSGNVNAEPILIIPGGEVVEVLDDSKQWWKIKYNGKTGYSNSKYLERLTGNDSETTKRNGKIVIVDPGHGGPDPGAVNGSIQENHLTMTFANKVKTYLEKMGYTVYLTRNGINDSCANSSGTVELKCRVDFAKSKKGDVFISIHMNSFTPGVSGTETYYSTKNPYPSQSKKLAETVHRSYQPVFGSRDRGVKTADWYVNRYASMPSILLEVGFMSDVNGDLLKLTNPTKQNQVSEAIAKGIDNYLK